MPFINATKFREEAEKVNKHLGRFSKSSLDPLFQELGTGTAVNADQTKMDKLQELIFHIPADKQRQYAAALNLLKTAGLAIGGRPCDPSMHFVRFDTGPYMYVGVDNQNKDQLATLDPGSLHHVFDFKWKSSNGDMQALLQVGTREHVKFRTSQQDPPFNDAMGTDREFFWGDSPTAHTGYGRDDHSIKPPKLVCRYPWVAGENVAEQWYQYTLDKGVKWHNVPGAAYLLTKGVRQNKSGEWVFFFRKSNWAPHNTKAYKFEAEYPLGGPLAMKPKAGQKWNRTNGTEAEIGKYGKLISMS